VDPEAEWVSGRTGIDGEHLIAVGVVGWSPCGLKLTPSELDRQPIGGPQAGVSCLWNWRAIKQAGVKDRLALRPAQDDGAVGYRPGEGLCAQIKLLELALGQIVGGGQYLQREVVATEFLIDGRGCICNDVMRLGRQRIARLVDIEFGDQQAGGKQGQNDQGAINGEMKPDRKAAASHFAIPPRD